MINYRSRGPERPAGVRRPLANSPFNKAQADPVPPEIYAVGDRVNHDKYGLGTVVTVEENSVVVDFGAETRRITVPHPKLSRI